MSRPDAPAMSLSDLARRSRLPRAPALAPWDGETLLTTAEAAAVVNVPEEQFRRDFLNGGRIPKVTLSGSRLRVRAQDLREYVNARTTGRVSA